MLIPKSNSCSRQYTYENLSDAWLNQMHFQHANQNFLFTKDLHNIEIQWANSKIFWNQKLMWSGCTVWNPQVINKNIMLQKNKDYSQQVLL